MRLLVLSDSQSHFFLYYSEFDCYIEHYLRNRSDNLENLCKVAVCKHNIVTVYLDFVLFTGIGVKKTTKILMKHNIIKWCSNSQCYTHVHAHTHTQYIYTYIYIYIYAYKNRGICSMILYIPSYYGW